MDKKRALVLMLFFAISYISINLLSIIAVNKESAHLSSLLRSSYEYCATASKNVFQDDYYQFDASISFSTISDSNTGINAEVLMQSNDSKYTSAVDWNADRLSPLGVAITKGIAKSYNLREGDRIYSKHIVEGGVRGYIIEQILPELSASRLSDKREFSDGIIIMGFDESYIESLTHTVLVYTEEPIGDVSLMISETPLNLIYRTDEIITVVKRLLPYWGLFSILAILLTVLLVILFTKNVEYNFRRFLVLGFDDKLLNRSYLRLVLGAGILPILFAFFISIGISNLFIISFIELLFLVLILFAELIALLISLSLSKSRLWR